MRRIVVHGHPRRTLSACRVGRATAAPIGEAVYKQRCAGCHEGICRACRTVRRWRAMSPEHIETELARSACAVKGRAQPRRSGERWPSSWPAVPRDRIARRSR